MKEVFMLKNKKMTSLVKQSAKLFFISLAFIAVEMLFSCSFAYDYNCSVRKSSEGLSIKITNYSVSDDDSRIIIAPGTCTLSSINKFVLKGTDTLNPSNTISQTVSIDDSGQGSISDLSKSFWFFELHAYSDSEGTNEILWGTASVDTRINSTISFTLSSCGLTTAGSSQITLTYDTSHASDFDEMVGEMHVYLRKAASMEVVQELAAITSEADLDKFIDGNGYVINESSLTPGSYALTIEFYQIANSSAIKIGFYSAGFIVEPGRQTVQSVTIPHIIAMPPAAPENLKVWRDDSTLTSESYNAVIRWDDSVDNEEYFQLVIREYSSSVATSGEGTVLNSSNYASTTFASNGIGYVSGSLFYGCEELVLKLSTGVLYDFELYAVNTYGTSSACNRVLSSDLSSDSSFGAMTGFSAPGDAAPYQRVNTFTISYNLSNGKLVTSLGNVYSGQIYREYKIYTGTSTTLLAPADIVDPTDNAYSSQTEWPVCYYSSLSEPWQKWVVSGSTDAVTSISTFTNRLFYAVYELATESTIYFDSDYLYVTNGATSAESVYGTGTDAKGATSLAVGSYITLTVNRASAPNSQFGRFDFYVNGVAQSYSLVSSGSSETLITYTFMLPLKGSYTVQVSGSYNEQYFYSQEFSFTVASS
ncbi:MAG: hypothetical protein K5829_08410 [Treponema sp.]|nr:hypothetical protein [Treponema sp.]